MRFGVNTEIGVVQAPLCYVLAKLSMTQPFKNLVNLVGANFDGFDTVKHGLRRLTEECQNSAQS